MTVFQVSRLVVARVEEHEEVTETVHEVEETVEGLERGVVPQKNEVREYKDPLCLTRFSKDHVAREGGRRTRRDKWRTGTFDRVMRTGEVTSL